MISKMIAGRLSGGAVLALALGACGGGGGGTPEVPLDMALPEGGSIGGGGGDGGGGAVVGGSGGSGTGGSTGGATGGEATGGATGGAVTGGEVACPPLPDAGMSPPELESIDCEVIIVGGGAAGLHTAFRLADSVGAGVCLFEKQDRLGGRIYDVTKDGLPESPRMGVGAVRIMETQAIVFALADELGIEYHPGEPFEDIIVTRGQRGGGSDALNASAFPAIADDADMETTLYERLMERTNVEQFADFRSYGRDLITPEGFQFLSDMSRFRADFQAPVDARGYMDYFVEEWDTCCEPQYPVGGMSEFIRRMEAAARDAGVRIFLSEPAVEINGGGGAYDVTTTAHVAHAPKLVIAVDQGAFKWVGGTVAASIQATPQFNALLGVKVATVTQWWPSAWWTEPGVGAVRRGRTTESCINVIEIPTDPYRAPQNVTRTVYDDDLRCVALWETYVKQGNTAAIEREISLGLAGLFPGVAIPQPDKTYAHIWENAWYWQVAGSTYTNLEIAQWALEPLPGEAVALVGESYNPQRSGWSDAAYKSSIATLNNMFGMMLEGAAATKSGRGHISARRPAGRRTHGPSGR